MQIKKIISFNTGRHYSEKGQRIAAAIHNGVVIMVDVDRNIDCAFPGIQLDRKSVLEAYDYDQGTYVNSDFFGGNGAIKMEFMDQLRDHARAFPGCILPK
jgi:hypothetical protein